MSRARSRVLARAALASAVIGALTITGASPASAEASGRILDLQSSDGNVRILFSAVGLPANESVDPASVTVTLDGQALTTTAVPAATSTLRRTAIVVIDTSGSMAGDRLTGAKQAASAFLSTVPADVQVGLVTFADTAVVKVAPTRDRSKVLSAVSGLVARGDTALYDAAILGVRTAGTVGARTVLLLSDGLDDGSKGTLNQAIGSVRTSKVLVSAVALGTGVAAPLVQISAASGGGVVEAAKAGDLASAFAAAARSISQQVALTAALPKGYEGTSGTIEVTARAGEATLTDSAFTRLQLAATDPSTYDAQPVKVDDGFLSSDTALITALVGTFLALLLLLAVAVSGMEARREPGVRRRLSVYTLTGRTPTVHETTALGDSAVARNAVDFADRVVKRRDFESGLTRKLEAAGVPLKPAEWLLLHTGTAVGLGILMALLSSGDPVAAVLGVLFGAALPQLYLSLKEGRRTRAFLSQLPDTLQLVAGSLSAGYSVPQALDTVVREGTQPIANEFNRALVESRLGVPVEDALESMAARMKSSDFAWVVMAIRIQREVGGNLAEVLSTVAETLRERERLRRQVQVLSAEGRLSAYILAGLPVVFGLYLLLVRRTYIEPLYTDAIGIFMLVVMGVLLVIGSFWLRKVVKVDV